MNHSTDTRAQLLVVARDLFVRRGYDAVSVREITSRAKANLGAITYHFGSKKALYHAAVESITSALSQAVVGATRHSGAPLDRIESMMRAFLAHTADHPGGPRILLRELTSDRPMPPPLAKAMQGNLGALTAIIVAGQADGSIRPGDPALLAMSVVAQPFYIRIAERVVRVGLGLDQSDPIVRDRIIDHVAESIRRTLASNPSALP